MRNSTARARLWRLFLPRRFSVHLVIVALADNHDLHVFFLCIQRVLHQVLIISRRIAIQENRRIIDRKLQRPILMG